MKDGDVSTSEFGTKIKIKIEDDHPIFDVNIDQLIYVLRTKTALGDCGYIWDDSFNCDCLVSIIDKAGYRQEKSFECAYLRPVDVLKSGDYIDLLDFKEWLKEQDRSDLEKRKKLINKVVTSVGKTFQSGREIRFWSCLVPRRSVWEQLSRNARIILSDNSQEDADFENSWIGGFSGGLWTSTKGMPTGISIDLRPKGSAGYVPNFFMIIDDPSLSFDIGRKSVQGRQQSMLRELAYDTFREYINSVRKYMGGALEEDPTVWERDEIFNSINELPNLDSGKTSFIKRPNAQEATVAAIFFELLGSGNFSQIKPLISGYKGRYDLYARWEKKNVVIEFKYDVSGLFKDFTDEKKMFDEVDVLVVWEVTEKDYTLAKRRGIEIFDIENTSLDNTKRFPGAAKTLNIPAVKPLFVVELRRLT